MEYSRRFKFLVCARNFEGDSDLEGARLSQIIQEIEQDGYQVLRARRDDDAELVVRAFQHLLQGLAAEEAAKDTA